MTTIPEALRHAVQPWNHILVAFSGGLDSTVLLHQLAMLRDQFRPELRLRAIHVHHGISQLADSWVIHCDKVCSALGVPLTICRVRLTEKGLGVEAQARAARYHALAQALENDEVLVTAQHQNDQCETLLLALKRGSGPAGLAAMPDDMVFHNSRIIRPFLNSSREDLEMWAREQHLQWIDDDSNQDDHYDRNFLRLRILPILNERWPHFARMVARSAALCGEQEQLLDELLSEELDMLLRPDGALALEGMRGMSPPRRNALLRRWLAGCGAPMPSRAALQRIWDEMALSRTDASPKLRFGDYDLRRYQDALWWVWRRRDLRGEQINWHNLEEPLVLPEGLGQLTFSESGIPVRVPQDNEPVSVRFTAAGTIYIAGRARGRTLKKLWQELNIAPWRRETTPLLFYGETLIAAPGIFVTRDGQADKQCSQYLVWQKGDE